MDTIPPPKFQIGDRVTSPMATGTVRGYEFYDAAVAQLLDLDDSGIGWWMYTVRLDDSDPSFNFSPFVWLNEPELQLEDSHQVRATLGSSSNDDRDV